MKPKFRSLIAAFAPLSRNSLIVCASLCAAATTSADQTWTGATDAAWATLTNWSGGALPGVAETAVFDATSTANLTAIALGANRTIKGINLTSPASDVTIAAGSTLTLVDGIDMSAATQGLSIVAGVSLGSNAVPSNAQSWSVASGQTLSTGAVPVRNSGANDLRVGGLLNVVGPGTTKLGVAALGVIADGGGNPFVTLNNGNDWAATDATGTVITATYTDFPTAGALAGFTNWNVTGSGAYTMNAGGPSSVRFNNSAGAITIANTGTSTLRGIIMATGAQSVTINSNFIRPNRVSTAGATMSFIQNSTVGDLILNTNLGNASSGAPVALVKSGVGKVIIPASMGYTGLTFIHGGTLQIGAGAATGSLTSTNTIVNNAALIVDRSDAITLSNVISGTGTLTKNGAGTLTLGNASTYTGTTTVNGGFVGIGAVASLGATPSISLNGGGILWTAAADISNIPITIGAGGTTFNTNGNAVTLVNSIGNSGTGSVIKSGAGSLTVSGDNLYAGGTTVSAGSLIVNNLTGSGTGSGAVVVNTGAALGGSGTISNSVNITTGANLTPGAGLGTLTVGSLDLDAGSTATFEFNNTPSNDQVAVANPGGLTIDGGAITLLDVTGAPIAFSTPGTYNLISYTGTIGGAGVSSLSVANPQPGFGYTFGTSGGFVTLTIATTGVVSKWITDGGGSWPVGTNWSSTVPNVVGAAANFTTILSAPAAVTLDGGKTVGAVTFLSGANGYTITQGSGGSLVFNNNLDPAAIANNDGNHEISAPITLTSNVGISTAAADDSTTLSGVVSGTGTLTKTGPGGLSLLGANNFSGNVTLSGGSTTFASGGLGAGNLAISGSSLVWAPGSTQDISNRTITFGPAAVALDTNGNNVALANSIGNSGTAAFTKTGTGRLTFAANPAFTGSVTISGGILQLGTGGTTGVVPGDITNNAELAVNLADASVFPNLVSGTGSLVHAGTGSLILNGLNTFTGTTSIPSLTASLILTNTLNLQSSTVQYDTVGGSTPTAGGSLSFGALTAVTLGGLSGNKNLVLENTTPAAVALTIGNNGQAATYSGALSGSGSLTKIGAGVSTLSGANTYAGTTTVSGGTLDLATGGSISGGAVTVANNGTLSLSGSSSSITAGALSNVANNTGAAILSMLDGTANFNAGIQALGNANNGYRIQVDGGTFSASSMNLGRGSLSFTTEALAIGSTTQGLYVNGGTVNITGALDMGVNANTNSSVSTLVAGGFLNVAGQITVGLNNGGRWSVLQVSGGEFNSTNLTNGLVLGGPAVGNAVFAVSGGVANVERIQFGQGVLAGTSVVRLTGGELYLGAGGIQKGSPNIVTETRLGGGLLGAKADWSSSQPFSFVSLTTSTIKAADVDGDPFNITLSGALTGTGGLDKDGAGTLTLSGAYTYTGNTTVLKGVLNLQRRSFDDAATVAVKTSAGAVLNLDYSGGDLVAGFVIDGDAQPDGIYGSMSNTTLGITKTPAITGNGLLYVNTALTSPFDSWAFTNGLTAGNNEPNDDPDKDGISNQLEFVLGGKPLESSTGVLPKLVADPSNFVFTFTRNDDSEAEIALKFEYGTDLAGWTPVSIKADTAASDPGVTVDEGTPATNPDVITVTVSKGANTTMFGRLKAVK